MPKSVRFLVLGILYVVFEVINQRKLPKGNKKRSLCNIFKFVLMENRMIPRAASRERGINAERLCRESP